MLGITAVWKLNQPSDLLTIRHFLRRRALAEVEFSVTSQYLIRVSDQYLDNFFTTAPEKNNPGKAISKAIFPEPLTFHYAIKDLLSPKNVTDTFMIHLLQIIWHACAHSGAHSA